MRFGIFLFFCLTILSCKEGPQQNQLNENTPIKDSVVYTRIVGGPVASIGRVFKAHGGLETWKTERTLSFTLLKDESSEVHTTDLYSRYEKIESANFAMGYDGKEYWLLDENQNYKGDPIFYHNLMFYFYAMPFVLADDGIMYSATENLEFEGESYPGIRISYEDGVGVSSKDEYFLHFDSETNQMAWLGYTVTYRSGEKSENIKWIRYNDWQEINGLVLPKSMTWHKVEDGKILEASSIRAFEKVTLSNEANADEFYARPEKGQIVTKK